MQNSSEFYLQNMIKYRYEKCQMSKNLIFAQKNDQIMSMSNKPKYKKHPVEHRSINAQLS